MSKRTAPNSTLPARTKEMKRSWWGSKTSAPQKKRDRERKDREFARKYHSPERVFFVQVGMGCFISGKRAENAHIERDGAGLKASYKKIVGLSPHHHTQGRYALDKIGPDAFEAHHDVDLEAQARRTDEAWRARGQQYVDLAKADGRFAAWQDWGE